MIEMKLKRNDQGFYNLDPDVINACYNKSASINELWGQEVEYSYWLENEQGKVLVKTAPALSQEYIMCAFAELLFSKFAEKNNIPCAKIDIAYCDKTQRFYTLSKSVLSIEEEPISVKGLAKMCGVSRIKRSATISEIKSLLHDVSRRFDILVKPQSVVGLKKYAITDFIASQRDRNITNLMFAVHEENGIKFISLKPLIDNEGGFGFDYLLLEMRNACLNIHDILGETKHSKKVCSLIKKAERLAKEGAIPLMGVTTPTDIKFESLPLKKLIEEVLFYKTTEEKKLAFCDEITSEMIKDEGLLKFFNGLSFDALACAEEIFQETGIIIPKQYLDLAQKVVDYRYDFLNNVLQEKLEEQREIQDEDSFML